MLNPASPFKTDFHFLFSLNVVAVPTPFFPPGSYNSPRGRILNDMIELKFKKSISDLLSETLLLREKLLNEKYFC